MATSANAARSLAKNLNAPVPENDSRGHLRFAVICASNMNRSMEAHRLMLKKGFIVDSFGTNEIVKLPGPNHQSNCYKFGVTYDAIYQDLVSKDRTLYKNSGILAMLERNKGTKPGPESFQDTKKKFDVIITCQDTVYSKVTECLEEMDRDVNESSDELVHIINVNIKDSYEDAMLGSYWICELARMICASTNLDKEIYKIVDEFSQKCAERNVLHSIFYY